MSLLMNLKTGVTYKKTYSITELDDDGGIVGPILLTGKVIAFHFNNIFPILESIRVGETTSNGSTITIVPFDAIENPDNNQFEVLITDEETNTIIPKVDGVKQTYWSAIESGGEVEFLWNNKVKVLYL